MTNTYSDRREQAAIGSVASPSSLIESLMDHELSQEGIDALLNGVTIPPRPSLLLSLDAELKSD